MVAAVTAANSESVDALSLNQSTAEEIHAANENHVASASEPTALVEDGTSSSDVPAAESVADVSRVGVGSPSATESVMASVDAMVAQAMEMQVEASGVAGVTPDPVQAAVDETAAPELQTTNIEMTPTDSAELHDEVMAVAETETPMKPVTDVSEVAATNVIEPPSAEVAPVDSGSAVTEQSPDVIAGTPAESITVPAVEDTPVVPPPATPEVTASSSTPGEPEVIAAPSAATAAPAAKSADEESFGEFENADELIKKAKEEEGAAARAAAEKISEAAPTSLTDLDASLAQEADKAMGTEEGDGPSPVATAAQPSVHAPKSAPAAKTEHPETTASQSAASVAPAESKSPSAAAASSTATAETKAPSKKARAAAAAHTIRRALKPVSPMAMKVLVPVATRYERLGPEKHKVIKLVAMGTIVQAAALWGYLMFGRSTDQAALEAAANAKVGAVHPVAASLPGSHSAEAEHEHGASESPASGHEPAAPSHAPAEDHGSAEKHGEKSEHGH
jgi:hypothetical protein